MGKRKKTLFDEFSRGFVRAWPGIPLDEQYAILMANGLEERQIWQHGRQQENVDTLAKAMRQEQPIGLSHGLRILGGSHAEIAEAARKIQKRGGVLIDAQTRERSDRDGISMLSRALKKLRGEKTMGDRAAEVGRQGGIARGKSAAANRMPEEKARKIWFSKRVANNADAISRMLGWSESVALAKFGPSGRKMGRPKSKT